MKQYILLFLVCMGMLLGSCSKDTELPQAPGLSYLMVYNGAPDFYGINAMAFINSSFYGNRAYNENGRGLLGAYNFSQYSFIDTGLHRIAYTDSAAKQENAIKVLETIVNFKAQQHYTVYLLDSLGFFETIFTEDDVTPSPTEAKFRLVHLSPDAGEVHLRIDTTAIHGIKGLRFRGVSDYVTITPDIKPGIRIMYYDAVTGEERSLVRKSFPVQAGKCYTMILRGYKTPPGNDPNKSINLSTITNF